MSDISTRLLLQGVRFGYQHVFVPTAMKPGAPEKYSVTILIPKEGKYSTQNKEALDAVIEMLCDQVKNDKKNKGKLPKDFDICLRDGDDDGDRKDKGDEYLGHWFVNAKSDNKPNVVGRERDENNKPKPIGPDEFKSGDHGRVTVNLYLYDTAGNTGIGAGLNNIQKMRDGESLAGRSSAASDFGDLPDEDDDTEDDNDLG